MMFFDFADVLAFGDTHSTIKAHLTKIADLMGLGVMADPYPEQGFFTRSDHYRFVQQGVPSVFMLLGFTATDGTNAGEQAFQTYLGQHYHKPSDDLAQPFDYVAGAKFVEFQYRLGESIANADERPEWNEGDFFGDLFGR
jgi:Zn-dependent M28 family amino/carboxypeptidase